MLKKIMILLSVLLINLSSFQLAEAKRFGGGDSRGHHYSAPSKTHNNSATNQMQKQNKLGAFGKILTALGLAALFSWLFSAHGMVGLMVVLLLIAGLIWMMRRQKTSQQVHPQSYIAQNQASQKDQSNHYSLRQGFVAKENPSQNETCLADNQAIKNGQLLDGTPEAVFNHQAMNLFHQLQTLNNKEGLDKIKSYLSEDLYQSVYSDIQENTELAEFKALECKIISCEKNHSQCVTSVMFVGQVKEDSQSNWQSFEEIWHFIRQDGEHLWRVAGIQQV